MPQPAPDFAAQYGHWLTSRLTQEVREGHIQVSTPFLDPLNDGMRVFVEPSDTSMLLHDGGLTLETLAIHGVDIHSTNRREALVGGILRSSGLVLEGDRIQTTANETNLSQRMHFLLSSMHRISDLWLTARQAGVTDFFEQVCGFLDEKEVLYSTNIAIPGKTVEHPIDIVIPLPRRRERLIRLIGTPNINSAKLVSFSWIEIAEARPESERIILLNDEGTEEIDRVRSISQQTESILRGYSSGIFKWSDRQEDSFEALWRAA